MDYLPTLGNRDGLGLMADHGSTAVVFGTLDWALHTASVYAVRINYKRRRRKLGLGVGSVLTAVTE